MFASYEHILEVGCAREDNASAGRVATVGAAAGGVSQLFHDTVMGQTERQSNSASSWDVRLDTRL